VPRSRAGRVREVSKKLTAAGGAGCSDSVKLLSREQFGSSDGGKKKAYSKTSVLRYSKYWI
jgi:hypothetical protein